MKKIRSEEVLGESREGVQGDKESRGYEGPRRTGEQVEIQGQGDQNCRKEDVIKEIVNPILRHTGN